MLIVIHPQSTTDSQGELENATNKGHNALSRYRKHGEKWDLEDSVLEFEQALRVCPPNHPCRAAAQSNLATAKFILCHVEDGDLLVPLGLYQDALATRPIGHSDRASTLIRLAAVYLARFQKLTDEAAGAQANVLLDEAMKLSSADSHANRIGLFMLKLHSGRRVRPAERIGELFVEQGSASRLTLEDLHNLSVDLLRCFQRSGDLADLQQAVSVLQELVRSTSSEDDRHRAGLWNLGEALFYRFERLGQLSDLEDAISRRREAVDLTPDGHPDMPIILNILGNSFLTRFKRLGQLSDLENAISRRREAVNLTPDGHPDKPSRLYNLGIALRTRFERLGQLGDLKDAISRQKQAVDLTPDGHPDKPSRLNNLGISFLICFLRLGQLNDLEDAISSEREAVDLTPGGHPDKPSCLTNLGNSFRIRFERFGQINDLKDAISRQKEAVDLTPDGHPQKPGRLRNLGNSFLTRFQRLGQLNDLEGGILRVREAVNLTLDGHPDKPGHLNDLGTSLLIRFEHLGQLSDLEDAISKQRQAVNLTPDGHPDKPSHLNNLGDSFLTHFHHLGQLNDLEDAISRQREAVGLTPDGHHDKPTRLNNLGISFLTRFQRLGQLNDLEDAILRQREAVDLTPDGHPGKLMCLHNLGNSFLTRFERFGQLSDLEDAISRLREVVDLTPDSHPHKPSRLQSLSNSFLTRFQHLGRLNDLEDAILMAREAVDLTPDGHPGKPGYLNNLGNTFRTRFERLGQLSDLEDAISRQGEAVDLTPDGHPDKSTHLNNLGISFRTRSQRLGRLSDMEHAISLFLRAASDLWGPARDRFRASQNWITCARAIHHPSLLHAYSVSINILPQLAWNGFSFSARYAELARSADVVREAAAAALESGFPETAVEWLEQGRSIVWGDLFQLRSSYEDLSFSYPNHAYRLRELSAALEYASATHEKSLSALSEPTPSATRSLQQEADKHRALAIERDKLLQDIRKLLGFERFLLQKDFSQLRASAHSGPVVILNAAETRCDALIVLSNVDHVIQVPLPNFTFQQSIDLQNNLQHILHRARKAKITLSHGVTWEPFLSSLWKSVVKPIMDALGFSVRDVMPLLKLTRSSISNRYLGTYLAFFGVRRAHSPFFLFMQRVFMIRCVRNSGTKYSTMLFHHIPLHSASLHTQPITAQWLAVDFAFLLSLNRRRMAYPHFRV